MYLSICKSTVKAVIKGPITLIERLHTDCNTIAGFPSYLFADLCLLKNLELNDSPSYV